MSLNSTHEDYLYGSYALDLRSLLKSAENAAADLSIDEDSEHRAVIGFGYDLIANRDVAIEDLEAVGVVLTAAQIAAINALNANTRGIPAALAGLALPNAAAANALLDRAISARTLDFDTFFRNKGVVLPDSREKAVLMSMWYQLPGYFGGELTKDLVAGNRAEVWYQIRYQSAAGGHRFRVPIRGPICRSALVRCRLE